MVIRCERCSTLYDLDESLLSPSGSQVQCTRCQHLFIAYPAAAPGRTLLGVPAQPDPSDGAAPHAAAPPAPALPRARSAPARAASASAKPEPKPVRTAPPPVYRPPPPPAGGAAAPGVSRPPVLRKDTVGAFEARLRWSARMRWLVPVAAAAVLVVVAGAWLLLARRTAGDRARAHGTALELAALDDSASLDRAIARLEEIERRSPGLRAVAADRALVQVLRAGALADEGDALAVRLAARVADRERIHRERPPGWEEAERAAAADVAALEPEARALHDRSRALAAAALEALRHAEGEGGETPEVVRGLAAYRALTGAKERVRASPRSARAGSPDPWLDLATAWADAREQDRAARERALVELGALAGSHPEILRGRLLLARTEAALGRGPEAIATLDALLAVNGRHEAARRLKDELSTPPPPTPAPPPAPPIAVKPAPHPRKIASQPPAAAPPTPPETETATAPPASPAAPPAPAPAPAADAAEQRTTPAVSPGGGSEAGASAPGPTQPAAPPPQPAPRRPRRQPDPEELPPGG